MGVLWIGDPLPLPHTIFARPLTHDPSVVVVETLPDTDEAQGWMGLGSTDPGAEDIAFGSGVTWYSAKGSSCADHKLLQLPELAQ